MKKQDELGVAPSEQGAGPSAVSLPSVGDAAPVPNATKAPTTIGIIRYRIAAWLCGGTVHWFEGKTKKGAWSGGLCLLSEGAMDAHCAVFRVGACNISETNLSAPDWPYNHVVKKK